MPAVIQYDKYGSWGTRRFVENTGSFTFKFAIKKRFNIGVFYTAFCMENMDVLTFESVTSYGAENMVNFTSKCAIKEKSKVPCTRQETT